jgi:hypothetical protein
LDSGKVQSDLEKIGLSATHNSITNK